MNHSRRELIVDNTAEFDELHAEMLEMMAGNEEFAQDLADLVDLADLPDLTDLEEFEDNYEAHHEATFISE